MKHIAIDLEMNTLDKKFKDEKKICGREIIQIGAVLLDDRYQEIGSFNTLVKPQYNERIERKFEKLTGITTEMVQNAPVFAEAIRQFLSWCHSIKDDIRIYQWSDYKRIRIKKNLLRLKRYKIIKKLSRFAKRIWRDTWLIESSIAERRGNVCRSRFLGART